MKIVIAIDSLKGSLTSMEAGGAIREGILHVLPDSEVIVKPLARSEARCVGNVSTISVISRWSPYH